MLFPHMCASVLLIANQYQNSLESVHPPPGILNGTTPADGDIYNTLKALLSSAEKLLFTSYFLCFSCSNSTAEDFAQ